MATTTGEPALGVADPHASPTIEHTPTDRSRDRTHNPDRRSTSLTNRFNTPINVDEFLPVPPPISRLLHQHILPVLPAPIISAPSHHEASQPESDVAEPSLPDPVLPRYLYLHPITLDPLFPELIPPEPVLSDSTVHERNFQ
ncbi:hypothetical protein QR685DRAFT_436176 [Neurospora intermedia]|uniref:Uncharacterized protein n=1 Tax=Neurospora intermedia TaxID=5142 RepID=A0ABR3DLP2_NEUIN